MPTKVCKRLMSVIVKFWWSGSEDSKGIHWCSKEKLPTRKYQEGLVFRDLKTFNLSMLTKQSWNLLVRPNSLCARVLTGLYYLYCLQSIIVHKISEMITLPRTR